MALGAYNFTIEQGSTFRKVLTYKDANSQPISLVGYVARMQARIGTDSPALELELTTENGGLTLGGVDGTVTLYMSHTDTAALGFVSAVYDLELVLPDGDVIKLVSGKIALVKEVSR